MLKKTDADLSKAVPTGPMGRIIERDINSLLDKGLTNSAAAKEEPASAAPAASAPSVPAAEYEDVKLEYSPRNCKEYACFAFKYGSAYAQRHI